VGFAPGQGQHLLVSLIAFLFEHRDDRPAQFLPYGLRNGPLAYHESTTITSKKRGPYFCRIRRSRRKAAAHSSSPWRIGSTSRITLNSGPLNCA